MRTLLILATGLVLVSAGCCTTQRPEPMTVQAAMQQVADGLNVFSALHVDKRSGLMPDEVIVVLNITEAQTTTGDAQAGVAAGPGKLLVDFSREHTETHGNQITLRFQNLLLAEKSTIAGSKSPEEIAALYQGLTNSNFMLKVAPPR